MKLIRSSEYSSCTSELCQIRATVRDACSEVGFEEADINCITLAIDEACTNIIRYAYGGEKCGRVILEIYQTDSEIIFRLTDFAQCIDKSCLEVKQKELLEPGGLGLQLIHQVMDSVQLMPPPKSVGNLLELKKFLPKG